MKLKILALTLAACSPFVSLNSALANFCNTTLTEVSVSSSGVVAVLGAGLPAAGYSVCTLSAGTDPWCGAMLRLLTGGLLTSRPVVLSLSGSGTCAAPTTIDYVKLK